MADDESRPVRPDGRVWKRRTMVRLLILLLIAGLMFLAALPFQMCRDWALVCETTGSHQGYRQWFTGHRTGQWYEKSHLEEFMEQQYPAELEHRWVSYSGTGRNILGQAILFGHGRPNDTLSFCIGPLSTVMWTASTTRASGHFTMSSPPGRQTRSTSACRELSRPMSVVQPLCDHRSKQ